MVIGRLRRGTDGTLSGHRRLYSLRSRAHTGDGRTALARCTSTHGLGVESMVPVAYTELATVGCEGVLAALAGAHDARQWAEGQEWWRGVDGLAA